MPEQPVLRAVVFDLDGLMFNTEELYDEVGEILLQRRGRHFSQQLKRETRGRPDRVSLQMMIDQLSLSETVEQLLAESDQLLARLLPARLQSLPGLDNLLAALETAAIPKAIATSSGRSYTARVLAQAGLQPRFLFALTGEDVLQGKPAPEVYLAAARRLGVPPAEVMVLEDSENGCRAGVAAGAYTVAVPGPHSRDHDFAGVALVVPSLADASIYRALGLPVPI